MNASDCFRRLGLILCTTSLEARELFRKVQRPTGASHCHRAVARIWLAALPLCALACGAAAFGQESGYEGDVTDVRVIRHVEKHPQAWRLWQPYIIQSTRQQCETTRKVHGTAGGASSRTLREQQ